MLSDTDTARLSISTFSTLPPSYRTRRSAASIYIPTPDYPPFPPPVYTPTDVAPAPAPPSAFRMLTRAPRRGLPAPAPPKVFDGRQSTGSTSGGRGSRGDGTRDGNRVEGEGEGEGREYTDADSAFSAGRDGLSVPDDDDLIEEGMGIVAGASRQRQ